MKISNEEKRIIIILKGKILLKFLRLFLNILVVKKEECLVKISDEEKRGMFLRCFIELSCKTKG